MTTGPRLRLGRTLIPGILAAVLFAAMALIVVNAPFEAMPSDPFGGTSVTANIGYAMFDLTALQEIDSEPFLASFILAAIVLDAALDASLVLAKQEEEGEPVTALSSTTTSSTEFSRAEAPSGEEGGGTAAADGGRPGGDGGDDA